MSVIDGNVLIRKYELGEQMTATEKELLTAALYFDWRSHHFAPRPAKGADDKTVPGEGEGR